MIVENQITKKRFNVTPEEFARMESFGVNKYNIIEDDAPMEVKSMREQGATSPKKPRRKTNNQQNEF